MRVGVTGGGVRTEREARLGVGDGHVVEHHRLQIALALSGAVQRGAVRGGGGVRARRARGRAVRCKGQHSQLLLLKDGLERLGGGGPRPLGLLEAQVVEAGADGDDHVAGKRVLGAVDSEAVDATQATLVRLWGGARCARDVQSGLHHLLPSARAASAGCDSAMAAAMASEGAICLGSVRTDIVKRILERGSDSGLLLRTYGTDVGR